MKALYQSVISVLFLVFAAGTAFAQDGGITMQVIEDELPEAVTAPIALPTTDEDALRDSADGLRTANEARLRRNEGLSTAREAMESGAAERREALESARGLSEHRSQTGGVPPFVNQ
ncbi:MAG TPA: hypothetical protein VMP00_17020 [Burkholderiales bacterium]|nr:hypothetical protein [Burkholderiales bacterium]